MKWTRKPPQQEGPYWRRDCVLPRPKGTLVTVHNFCGWRWQPLGSFDWFHVGKSAEEWSGPLVPPKGR